MRTARRRRWACKAVKPLFAVAGALALLGASAPPANYNAFGVSILRRLAASSPQTNVFISPESIGMALSMAADGAAGSTRSAIDATLQLSQQQRAAANAALTQSLKTNHDATVGIANAVWFRQDLPPRDAYVKLLHDDYGAQAQALHFGDPSAAEAINAWTKEHTLGLIDKLVDSTQNSDFLYLTNALAFKAKWTVPFQKSSTHSAPFTDASGKKHDVDMMSRTGSFSTIDTPQYRALRLPYGSGGYAAYILLPARSLDTMLSHLQAADFDRIAHGVSNAEVGVSIPRFTARYDASLVPALRAMGMSVAFGDGADFSGMHLPPPRLAISQVRHSTYVRVDEDGTTAAAATSVGIVTLAMRIPAKTFVVDRPFVFAIRDERTGSLLFAGAIRSISP